MTRDERGPAAEAGASVEGNGQHQAGYLAPGGQSGASPELAAACGPDPADGGIGSTGYPGTEREAGE